MTSRLLVTVGMRSFANLHSVAVELDPAAVL